MDSRRGITKIFNGVLFLYLCVNSVVISLFEPESKVKAPWDAVFEWSPSVAVTTAVIMAIILVLWGTALVRIFWNGFISDVFKIREISFDESMAIVLMIAILSI